MCQHCMNRRDFGALTAAGLAGGVLGLSSVLSAEGSTAEAVVPEPWDPDKPPVVTGRPLRVQPILAHAVMSPREKTSWRSWSEIINEPAAAEELQRIGGTARLEQAGVRGGVQQNRVELAVLHLGRLLARCDLGHGQNLKRKPGLGG